MKQFIYLFLIVIFSCEKDDICPETTQTTPRLVIEFYDLTNPDVLLQVPGLYALGLSTDGIEIPINNEIVTTRSSIELPLKTDDTETEFILYKSYDIVMVRSLEIQTELKLPMILKTFMCPGLVGIKQILTFKPLPLLLIQIRG